MADNTQFDKTVEKLTQAVNKMAAGGKTDNIEKEREQSARENQSNEYLRTIAEAVGAGASGSGSVDEKSKKKGGLLAGIGGALGGMGIGAGVAMGGLGALFAGGGYLLKQLAEFDGKAVVKNVKELFKIVELTDGIGDAFSKGGAFLLTMTGIGVGLAVFGLGSSIAGLADGLTNFVNPNWAKSIVDNVVTLLSISDEMGGTKELMGKSGAFFLSMSGIGFGLAMFGAGSAIAGLADGLTNFGNPAWAQSIVDNVVTLLSISDHMGGAATFIGESAAFLLSMSGIGAGLAVFGVGSALVGLAQFITSDDWAQRVVDNVTKLLSISKLVGGVGDALSKGGTFFVAMTGIALGLGTFAAGSAATGLAQFITSDDWASRTVNSVKKLMEIASLKFGDVAKFTGFMTAIAAGLVAFAVGKGTNVMGDVIGKFTGNFADNIVKDVKTLMGMINDPDVSLEKANTFSKIMGTIAAGLAKFAGGKFLDSLAGAAASVMNFLTGNNSPIEQMQIISKNAVELEKGASAIGSIAENLDKIGGLRFKGGDLGIEDFAEDLLDSIPDIEVAIKGGKVSTGIFSGTTIKGLGSKDIPWEQAGINLRMISEALNMGKENGTGEDYTGTAKRFVKKVENNTGRAMSEAELKKQSTGSVAPVVISAPITKVDAGSAVTHHIEGGRKRNPLKVG